MTLSTPAEHRRADEIDYVRDQVELDVTPETAAEERVMELEGRPDDPATVESPHAIAKDVADDVRASAESTARRYTDSVSLAEDVGISFADDAYEATMAGLRGSPAVELPGEDDR